jgi:glutaconyl-CoA/methylmalonyl-CoA decarboxylase subunit gamma
VRYYVTIDGSEQIVDVERLPDGRCRATLPGGSSWPLQIDRSGGGVLVTVGERVFDLVLEPTGEQIAVYAGGRRHVAKLETHGTREVQASREHAAPAGGAVVVSPMPGKVVQLLVQLGQAVDAGAPVIVIEAMKMENQLAAAAGGVVKQLLVKAGDNVESGTRLLVIE